RHSAIDGLPLLIGTTAPGLYRSEGQKAAEKAVAYQAVAGSMDYRRHAAVRGHLQRLGQRIEGRADRFPVDEIGAAQCIAGSDQSGRSRGRSDNASDGGGKPRPSTCVVHRPFPLYWQGLDGVVTVAEANPTPTRHFSRRTKGPL